jgi:hypothetical protein
MWSLAKPDFGSIQLQHAVGCGQPEIQNGPRLGPPTSRDLDIVEAESLLQL